MCLWPGLSDGHPRSINSYSQITEGLVHTDCGEVENKLTPRLKVLSLLEVVCVYVCVQHVFNTLYAHHTP